MADAIAQHYERHAHAFDTARRGNFVERHWLQRLAVSLPRGGTVLDLGCGGGEPVSRFLVDAGFKLTGVDTSERMLGLWHTRFGRHTAVRGDMRTVAIEGEFDAVLAWDSLFHLRGEDQRIVIARAAAWLKSNGRFLFNTGSAAGEAIGTFEGEDLYHASLDPADYRDVFARVGLSEVVFAPDDQAAGGRSVWLTRKT